ncbi:MAG: DUF2341 domain-containing protein [Chthoniobacteraceae bacterium]
MNHAKQFRKYSIAVLLAWLTMSGLAHAWWNDEWTARKKITLDTTDKGIAIADPAGTVPVLVRLHEGNFKFDQAKDDGSDLRIIAADDKTALTFHVEKWDALMGEAFVWVKVPDVKPGAQITFWLYYGNAGPKAVRTEDAKGTYDANTALVLHFGEHGTPPADFSASGVTAEKAGVAVDGSMIGTGLKLDGKAAIKIPTAPGLFWKDGDEVTWSAWVKSATAQSSGVIYVRREGNKAFIVGLDNHSFYVEVSLGGNGTRRSPAGPEIAAGAWHHLAVTAANGKLSLYLDGAPYSELDAALPGMNSEAMIGGDTEATSSDATAAEAGFQGELDELNISKIARPVSFLKFAAVQQGGGDKPGLTFGEDEQTSSWFSGGYFGVIIKNLSVDGWVVIGILSVMSCISWYVMVTKMKYLNTINAGNSLFLQQWRHIAKDLTVLDDSDAHAEMVRNMETRVDKPAQRAMRQAPLYRIYHLGVDEIRHRMAEDQCVGRRKGLAGRSIQAIRAALDGGLVRETQRVNSKIVLLTICISGGPFLGLLGTVVGVMITFAAVAAAGEVNVNAIAPGIAAALLATVAGLAVAIPALFGYNYILTRVKESTSDMHVFIDEFVTRMAEFYKE